MNRGELTNIQWERLQPLLPPQKPKTGRPAHDHRTIINGILWMLRTGAPWRDLPERYGPWRTVASRCDRWQQAGIWSQLLAAVHAQAEGHGPLHGDVHGIDGPMIRAHQHAAGATQGTPSPQPAAAAGAGSGPTSTCEPTGVASGCPACGPRDRGTRRSSVHHSWRPGRSSGEDRAVPSADPIGS